MVATVKDISARKAQHPPVRLLVAVRSENEGHELDSLLRDHGIATRMELIELPMAIEKLPIADMLLCNAELPELKQILPRLAGLAPRVPMVVINSEDGRLSPAEGMELGAADVVAGSDHQHLVLVVKRELEHVRLSKELEQASRALTEAEQRCNLLLQSSRAAIAYVHEGMHVYANDIYLSLFGFADANDLLGLPLIDLLDGDSAATLKDRLKQLREQDAAPDFDFLGRSSDGAEVTGSMTLAAADYEGEHCVQVTVRVDQPEAAGDSGESEPGAVPTLLEDAIIDSNRATETATTEQSAESTEQPIDPSDQPESAGNVPTLELVPDTDTEAAEQSNVIPFEATVEPASASAASPDGAEDTTLELVSDSGSPTEPADPAPATGTRAAAGGLGEFLKQSETVAAQHESGFVSIFAAQVDGYEEMQRGYGLAGAEEACRAVEAVLLTEVEGPFMQISTHQWVMLVCANTREDGLQKVEGYRAAVEAMMFEVREKTVRPSCSFGGSILNTADFDSMGAALEATLNNAFTTLRVALDGNDGNAIELPQFDNAQQRTDDEANRILSLISEAIENESFVLLFQPIISLRGDSEEHYEVFLRMNDREGQQMAPGEFLRTAIDNGVAGKIDRWVILQSIKMLSAHRANGHNTRLTINLTSNSVVDPEFIQWLGVAIKAARLPSDAVIFQLTEQDASTYVRQTREFTEGLKNLHCRSSLSRFGLELEPFEVLNHIPVDFVKLDGSLVASLEKDPAEKERFTELIGELQNSGKLTVVPMVENASLLSTLWQAGVNYIQGHYLQEPSTSMDYDFSTDD